jgi:hypothetical protein
VRPLLCCRFGWRSGCSMCTWALIGGAGGRLRTSCGISNSSWGSVGSGDGSLEVSLLKVLPMSEITPDKVLEMLLALDLRLVACAWSWRFSSSVFRGGLRLEASLVGSTLISSSFRFSRWDTDMMAVG